MNTEYEIKLMLAVVLHGVGIGIDTFIGIFIGTGVGTCVGVGKRKQNMSKNLKYRS